MRTWISAEWRNSATHSLIK